MHIPVQPALPDFELWTIKTAKSRSCIPGCLDFASGASAYFKLAVPFRNPLPNFVFSKSPLPSDFATGYFAAFSPKANSARRDAQPFSYM